MDQISKAIELGKQILKEQKKCRSVISQCKFEVPSFGSKIENLEYKLLQNAVELQRLNCVIKEITVNVILKNHERRISELERKVA